MRVGWATAGARALPVLYYYNIMLKSNGDRSLHSENNIDKKQIIR